ncbi:MAG: polysaccharide biosynthesis/export family protein [Candidatus Omnitrophica bacterium]|nr:polysaccharide biosynthesis/export family protein [Candidatus Omnitrophota bacterium]
MTSHWRGIMKAVGVALPLLLAGQALAEEEGSLYGGGNSSGYSPYQASPAYQGGSADSGIIGYQPISNDALPGMVPAQPQATAAYAPLSTPGSQIADKAGPFNEEAKSKLPPAYLTGILGDGPYTLGRDDVIRIIVRNQPEFSGDFAIGFDGRIQYNYLGDIPLAGLTKYEVQQVMEKLLAKYIRVPSVNVQIMAYNSKVIYVIGEVGRPGKFIMRGDVIKLREAILAAGLTTHNAALGRVHVIKPDLNDPRVRVVNIKRILYKGKLKDDVDLYPGEIVVVPSTVLSKVNNFLGTLLSPVTRAASVAALAAL